MGLTSCSTIQGFVQIYFRLTMSGSLRSCSGSRPAAPRARPQASEAPTRPKEKRGGATSTRTCPWRGKLHCTTTTPQSFRQMLTVRWSWLSRRVTSSQFMETWMMTAFTWGSLEGNVDLCPGKMDYFIVIIIRIIAIYVNFFIFIFTHIIHPSFHPEFHPNFPSAATSWPTFRLVLTQKRQDSEWVPSNPGFLVSRGFLRREEGGDDKKKTKDGVEESDPCL